jgi:4-aminobutyrate--pyruvate transaminase
MVNEAMYQAILDESRKIGTFGHGFTYSGHPVAAAVGVKTLEIYERDDIVGRARRLSPYLWRRLDALRDHPLVGEVRGRGLVAGIELVADKLARRPFQPRQMVGALAAAAAQREGVIVRNIGDTLAICPPLIITESEIDEMMDKLVRALDRSEAQVAQGHLRNLND